MAQMEKINLRAFPQRRTAATYIFRFELEVSFSPFFTIQCWLSNVKHLKKARSPNIATSSSMLASANAFAVPANTTSLHSVASSRVVTVFGYYLVAKNSIKSEINRKVHSLLPPKSSFRKSGSGEDRILSNFFPSITWCTDYIANIFYVGEHRPTLGDFHGHYFGNNKTLQK